MSRQAPEEAWTEWMRAAASGDTAAYRQFLVSVTPHLRAVARHRCKTHGAAESEAEDVVQEVLLAIHLKRGTWDPSRPIGPWIGAIVRNKLVDALRRRVRHSNVPLEEVLDTLATEERNDDLSPREMDVLLMQLKAQHQDVIRAISINGCSVRETAGRLQMSEGAVRVTLHRALKALAALYWGQNR